MNNKLHIWVAVIGSTFILIVGSIVFYQMYNKHLLNEQIIEDCFKYLDQEEVVIVKDSSWSPARCVNAEK